MSGMIILIAIFLVIVYAYIYTKIKKNKERTNNINSVRDFNNSYKYLTGQSSQKQFNRKNTNNGYNNYVTKYNSSEDYREKR
ncbi:MAG: FeoB-associated Cys-rich membrane protein [Lachnospiraceae bacterium]|nr:FeoB-associated Cys-rich membrane protein [Lachnospiraceae bacterium]